MKKIIILLTIVIIVLSVNKKITTKIPEESIRFRIIANSNTEEDQALKKKIVKNLSKKFEPIQEFQTISETRSYIKKELPEFTTIVEKTIQEEQLNKTFHINYGKNIFPEKKYNNEVYPEKEYESLVITLGEGKGDNFWCVLFPPLCFIEEGENVEYKSWIKELIDKYF